MGQTCGHRSEPDLSHSPSPFCLHAIHHVSLPSGPQRLNPVRATSAPAPTSRSAQPVAAPVRWRSRPPPRPRTRSAAMQSHEASSSETTTCENFLYCYQGSGGARPRKWPQGLDGDAVRRALFRTGESKRLVLLSAGGTRGSVSSSRPVSRRGAGEGLLGHSFAAVCGMKRFAGRRSDGVNQKERPRRYRGS